MFATDTLYRVETPALVRENCRYITTIPAGLPLSDQYVKKFFGADESNMYWERLHKPSTRDRLVFDKCVVPYPSRELKITTMEEYENETDCCV